MRVGWHRFVTCAAVVWEDHRAKRARNVWAITWLLALLFSLLVACPDAFADSPAAPTASLTVADKQNPDDHPYRTAILTISAPADYRTVRLRWRQGGPTMEYPIAIPPDAEASLAVALPAIAMSQAYDVLLLAENPKTAPPLSITADITWPPDLPRAGAFIDPAAYEALENDLPVWPASLKQTIFLGAVLLSGALAAVLFIRRKRLRLPVLAVVLIAAVLIEWQLLSRQQTLLAERDGKQLVLRCRRTSEVLLPCRQGGGKSCDGGKYIVPIYAAPWQMKADNTIIHTADGTFSLTIQPDEIRLFQAD